MTGLSGTVLRLLALLLLGVSLPLCAQVPTPSRPDTIRPPATQAPVVYRADTLFTLYGRLGPFGPRERAEAVEQRIRQWSRAIRTGTDSVRTAQAGDHYELMVGDAILMTILESSHITNFTSMARNPGLILHTTVTIGYDAPWRQVHDLLLAAATATPNLLPAPAPFVLQTGLDDFYVRYQINAVTDQPAIMAATYSALHQNIQDQFFKAGVEIMSPHYAALREGNRAAIPADQLGAGYVAPRFRVTTEPERERERE